MMPTFTTHSARRRRGGLPLTDDEFALALHAAGASNEDVALCLVRETTAGLRGKNPRSAHRRASCARRKA
jgi:hypothetical protein